MAVLNIESMLVIPDHIRLTFINLVKLGRADAGSIAKQTHRHRAVESSYLNLLCTIGYATKVRKGKKTWFTPSTCVKSEVASIIERIDKLSRENQGLLARDVLSVLNNCLLEYEKV